MHQYLRQGLSRFENPLFDILLPDRQHSLLRVSLNKR
jgi:hypothetical protein